MDTAAVSLEVGALVPDVDVILVFVNHVQPGGTGADGVAVSYAGGWLDGTAIHELGHSAFGLGDEYPYLAGCASGETTQDQYTGAEPLEPNLTINVDRATIKWASYVDASTPLPTTVNPDPTQCDTQPNPFPDDTIGAYEAAATSTPGSTGRRTTAGCRRPTTTRSAPSASERSSPGS
ncbi:MAG: M64 family metallopeptidase [Nocardioides sp.]